ncbi:MAG: polyamine aminopropyltransferase [Acidilobaceae archaeon]
MRVPYLLFIEWDTPTHGHVKVLAKIIEYRVSKYQEIIVAETKEFGRLLILDGKTQSSEVDEFIYHESLTHPAMILHGNPKNVLILGGGEGATAREVLKYKSVKRVVMVDIDEEVVRVSREHLEFMNKGVFDNPRLELKIGDALDYVYSTNEKFDVVIADLSDPIEAGPSYKLYTKEFYERLSEILEEGGVFVTQATSPIGSPKVHAVIYNTIRSVFRYASYYHVFVPSFETLWGFVIASNSKDPASLEPEIVDKTLRELNIETRFYDSKAHRHMFSVSKYLRTLIESEKSVAVMDNPVFMPA